MRKMTARILTGVAIVIVALGVLYAIAVAVSAAKLRRAYAMLEEAGRPMDTSHVIPPPVPDPENAALLYESAILLLKAQPAPEENLLKYLGDLCSALVKEGLEDDKRAELEQLLAQDVVARALSVIEQATQRPACRFERDYDAGINMLLPHMGSLRGMAFILAAKTRIEAETGRGDAAWDLVRTQLEFADALRADPVIVGQLVRIAMIGLSCDTIQWLCEVAPPSDARSRAMGDLLGSLDGNEPMILALDGERLLFGEWMFNLPRKELREVLLSDELDIGESGLVAWLKYKVATFRPLFMADHAAYLRLIARGTRYLAQPYDPSRVDDLERASRRYLLTSYIIPAIMRVDEIQRRTLARLRIAGAGLALLRYREAHGAFPAALDAPALGNVTDSFSEKPLIYKAQGKGFVLYSVAEDQKDNGGIPKQPEQEGDYDYVWRFGAE